MHPGHLELRLSTSFSERQDVRQGTEIIPDPMAPSTRAWVLNLGLTYGVTERLAIQASIPYLQTTFKNVTLEEDKNSFGDLTLTGRYVWSFFNGVRVIQLAISGGLNIPVGGGVQNPITSDRNFVSGTVDPVLAASFAFPLSPVLSLDANVYARPILTEDSDGSKNGCFVSYSFTGRYKLRGPPLDFSLRVSGLNRTQDKINGVPFPNSGGDWLFLTPGISWDLSWFVHDLGVWGAFEVPVYQLVEGTQLTEDWTARLGVRYGFDLFSGEEHHEEQQP